MIAREKQGNRMPPRRPRQRVKRALRQFKRLRKDDDGETLIEYSILIGLLTTVVMLMVLAISGWIADTCSSLNSALT